MKLLLIHNFYRSNHIGGEDIVFSQEYAALTELLGPDRVFSYTVHNDDLNPWNTVRYLHHNPHHEQAVFDLIREHKIDVVHLHNFFPQLTPSVILGAKRAGAIVFHTLHNYRWWCVAGTLHRKNKATCLDCFQSGRHWPAIKHACYRDSKVHSALAASAFNAYQDKKIIEKIDHFFYLSSVQKKQLVALGLPDEKLLYKPNAVPYPEFVRPHNQKKDFIFVGRLEKGKGIENLLENFPDNIGQLKIIGHSEHLEELKKKYNNRPIVFLGKLSHEQTLEHMQKARYLVQPSLFQETFGLTTVEAMAQGTPVIAFPIGTRKALVRSGYNGYLCTPQTLRSCLLACSEDKNYDQLCEGARATSVSFSKKELYHQQLRLYESCLKKIKINDHINA